MKTTRLLRWLAWCSLAGAVAAACGGSSDDDGTGSNDGGKTSEGGTSTDASLDTGSTDASSDAISSTDASDASSADASDGSASAPPQVCTPAAALVDVSTPTTVVGTGTATSCTASALASAVATGGIITFACGAAPATLTVTTPLAVTSNTTIDGNHLVTLSGGGTSRILTMTPGFTHTTPLLTVQRLALIDGVAGKVDGGTSGTTDSGGAIYAVGGSVTVIDSTFSNNQSATPGQDVGGGAIFVNGDGVLVVDGAVFDDNKASNGGAIKTLSSGVTVTNSRFSGNAAIGTGGDPGNGGNGGGFDFDGPLISLSFCGVVFENNSAGAFGGALFRVGYDLTSTTTIDRSTFDGNTSVVSGGAIYLQDHTVVLTNTTLSHNTGTLGTGAYFPATKQMPITLENDTIAFNTATTATVGGAVSLSGGDAGVVGSFTHCTIANNVGVGVAGAASSLTLSRCIITNNNNTAFQQDSCHGEFASGTGVSIQFPVDDEAGVAESACAPGVVFADPHLGALQSNGGPTFTMVPAAGSPAESDAGCSGTDQRGVARSKCTSGAVEGL